MQIVESEIYCSEPNGSILPCPPCSTLYPMDIHETSCMNNVHILRNANYLAVDATPFADINPWSTLYPADIQRMKGRSHIT